jgi:hypothetical protein
MPLDSNSDPDVYVSEYYPEVSKTNSTWKNTSCGPVILQIHPSDPYYSLNEYYVRVYGSKMGMNSFSLSLNFMDPSILLSCFKGICSSDY